MWNKSFSALRAVARRCTGGLIAVIFLASASPALADVVSQWNEISVRTLTTQTPALSPFAQARFAAIVQLAVFEAVNAISGEYDGYLGSPVAPTAGPIVATGGASSE